MHLPYSNGVVYWDGNSSNRIQIPNMARLNTSVLWTGWNSNTKTPKAAFYSDGALIGSNNNTVAYTGNNSPLIVGNVNPPTGWTTIIGDVGEIIYYTDDITETDKRKIETYLAIKYGISLYAGASSSYLS